MSKDHKLSFAALATAVDQRDTNWLSRQPEDAQKAFALPAMRFVASSDGKNAGIFLWLVNRRVNYRLFDLRDRDLSYRLLASCGLGRGMYRNYLHGPSRASNPAYALLAKHNPLANDAEIRMLLSLYSRDEFANFVAECGLDKHDAKVCLEGYDRQRV